MPKLPANDLGFAHVFTTARNIDWAESYGDDCDGWQVIMPAPSMDTIAEYAPDLLTASQRNRADKPNRLASDSLASKFDETDGYQEWAQTYEPMMNYVWPVSIRYGGASAQEVAALLDQHASAISLIYFGDDSPHCPEEYGFALTGGGMNLADHIVAAYLCAGHVPPLALMEDLSRASPISKSRLAGIGDALKAAYKELEKFLMQRAGQLMTESDRVFSDAA